MAPVSTPWYVARYVYAVLIGLFLAALFVQVYFAGRFVFGVEPTAAESEGSFHEMFGWMLAHGLMIFPFIAGFFARGGKKIWLTNIVWGVCVFVLPMLAGIMYVEPGSTDVATQTDRNIAAFHPVLAVIVIGLTGFLAYHATKLAAEGRISTAPSPSPSATARPRAPRPPAA